MIRSILTLCCLVLLGAAIAGAAPETNHRFAAWLSDFGRQPAPLSNLLADARYVDCQHSLPLFADADETDDTEEPSDRERASAGHYVSLRSLAGPSPRAAQFDAAIQHRLANTLNALRVRLQI